MRVAREHEGRTRGVNSVAVGFVALTLLVAALTSGAWLDGRATLSALPDRQVDLGSGSIGRVAPVRQELIVTALGTNTPKQATTTTTTATVTPTTSARPAPAPRPPASPPPEPVATQTSRGVTLTVLILADRPRVKGNELLTYTISVANIGDVPYTDRLGVEAHVPAGTVKEEASVCQELPVLTPLLGPVCLPGLPILMSLLNEHQITAERNYTPRNPLEPGQAFVHSFTVRVQPQASPGAELVNHAHMQVGSILAGKIDSEEVKVIVEDGLVSQPQPSP